MTRSHNSKKDECTVTGGSRGASNTNSNNDNRINSNNNREGINSNNNNNGGGLLPRTMKPSGFLLKFLCGSASHQQRDACDMVALERRRRSVESGSSATNSDGSETDSLEDRQGHETLEESGEERLLEEDGQEEEEEEDGVSCIGRSTSSTSSMTLPGRVFHHLSPNLSTNSRLQPHKKHHHHHHHHHRRPQHHSTAPLSMSTPSILGKLGGKVGGGGKPLKVLILGQAAVGKTALTVRFITKRFIGEYDPTLERKYTYQSEIDHDPALFEIFDTAGQNEDSLHIEENIRWADAFILVYSVTDRLSFDECTRLKFLINHRMRRSPWRRTSQSVSSASNHYVPVVLVGNQNDLAHDRMVTFEEGQRQAENLGCTGFYDISVRESYEEVRDVFHDLYVQCKVNRKLMKTGSPPLTRGLSSSAFTSSMLEDHSRGGSLSDNENSNCSGSVKSKTSVSKRFMRRVFKQDSFFKDSITKLDPADELKEDSGQDSV